MFLWFQNVDSPLNLYEYIDCPERSHEGRVFRIVCGWPELFDQSRSTTKFKCQFLSNSDHEIIKISDFKNSSRLFFWLKSCLLLCCFQCPTRRIVLIQFLHLVSVTLIFREEIPSNESKDCQWKKIICRWFAFYWIIVRIVRFMACHI